MTAIHIPPVNLYSYLEVMYLLSQFPLLAGTEKDEEMPNSVSAYYGVVGQPINTAKVSVT